MKRINLGRRYNKYAKRFVLCMACLLATLLPLLSVAQADIHFSQFYETSILRNPALTGVFADDYKFGAYYRNQWSSVSHPYVTGLISGEIRVSMSSATDDFLSFGLLGYTDKAGSIDQKITGVYPALNYNKSINPEHNGYLSVGFTAGYLQYSFDPDKATFNNQYQNGHFNVANPSLENLPNAKMTMWDMGAGINFNTSAGENNNVTYVVGIAGYHFTQPKFSYYEIPGITQNMRWNGNFGISSNLSEQVLLQVQTNYAMQGTYHELMLGGLINWTKTASNMDPSLTLGLGAFYRYADAIIPVVRLKYRNMSVGVSYDVNTSTLKEASRMDGGFELTLFVTGNYSDKSGIVKKTVCPRF